MCHAYVPWPPGGTHVGMGDERVPDHRLKGFDREWVDAGGRRLATYTNLPPGQFEFQVLAANLLHMHTHALLFSPHLTSSHHIAIIPVSSPFRPVAKPKPEPSI